ncbi:MAG: hypothetical protein CVU81_00285 [Euryarchaeota archaeon HGW-Euryarchaeota-1]|nr:MAG: hypothetical protein CVU81_00285 [Euryarchaeota archaeon HGW-Euryarchaeota-1]
MGNIDFPKQKNEGKYLLDTSIIINQKISELIKTKDIPSHSTIIVPTVALRELEHQANRRERIGYAGIEELQTLQNYAKEGYINLIYEDVIYTPEDVDTAKLGALDALIIKAAIKNNAIFITADKVQSKIARAQGCEAYYYEYISGKFIAEHHHEETPPLSFEKFFDKNTMSIHILQDGFVFAKIRENGKAKYTKISQNTLAFDEIKKIEHEIKNHPLLVSETATPYYNKGKIDDYRITIVNPPFSARLEINIIKQRITKTFADYKISEQQIAFLKNTRGVIISSKIGGGKTSFARALFVELSKCGDEEIAKIIESQPEQIVCENTNQYDRSTIPSEDLNQFILSSRTDRLLFDEIKTQDDLKMFTNFRLADVITISTLNIADEACALHFIFSNIPFIVASRIIDAFVFLNEDGSVNKILIPKIKIKKDNVLVKMVDLKGKPQFECYNQQNDTIIKSV